MSGAFVFFGSIGGKAEASECGVNACAVPWLLQGGFRHRFFTYRYVLLRCRLSDFHSANMKDFSKKRRKPFRRLYDDDLHAAYPPFLGYRLFLYEIQYACRNDDKCFQYNECAAGQEKGQQNSCSKRQNDHAEYLACVSDSAHPPSLLPHCCSDAFCFYCMRQEGIRCMRHGAFSAGSGAVCGADACRREADRVMCGSGAGPKEVRHLRDTEIQACAEMTGRRGQESGENTGVKRTGEQRERGCRESRENNENTENKENRGSCLRRESGVRQGRGGGRHAPRRKAPAQGCSRGADPAVSMRRAAGAEIQAPAKGGRMPGGIRGFGTEYCG